MGGIALYASFARQSPERFLESVRGDVEESAEDLVRKVRRLEAQATAVAKLLDDGTSRKQAGKLLPGDGRDERIAKYERHLHNLLTQPCTNWNGSRPAGTGSWCRRRWRT